MLAVTVGTVRCTFISARDESNYECTFFRCLHQRNDWPLPRLPQAIMWAVAWPVRVVNGSAARHSQINLSSSP
jgi:hypothetical protein